MEVISPRAMATNDARETIEALLPEWIDPDGVPVACIEKIKMLNENIVEIREMCREALEDAVLMGCDEKHCFVSFERFSASRATSS